MTNVLNSRVKGDWLGIYAQLDSGVRRREDAKLTAAQTDQVSVSSAGGNTRVWKFLEGRGLHSVFPTAAAAAG